MPELDQQWTAPQGSVRTQDGPDPPGCGLLDRRWVLWEEFMKEHAHLDAWLRLAEQDVCSLPISPSQVTYDKAKEELRKLERWRSQASSRLILLDRLTLRTRTLTRLFDGAVRAQLLTWAQECGRRWDEVSAKLESVSGGLKLFVSEWEEFEAEREELALWLADMDVRLTEVDRLMGNTCQKLRRLQCLQQCVCVNLDRVNSLLLRGEALICGSRTTDAEQVERRLVDLLQKCTHMCNNMTRTHTRLLSRKLVFEDTCLQSHASDSGCPSESLLDDEGALDKLHLDLPASPNHCTCVDLEPKGFEAPSACSGGQGGFVCTHLPSFTDPPPPSHEHLGLEWDPSVDIGRSVSCDDADAEVYVISCTGLCCTDGAKRPNYLSDISDDITNQDGDSVCNDLFMFIGQKLPEQLEVRWTLVPSLSSALSPVCPQVCPQFVLRSVPSLSSALSPVCLQLCPQFVPSLSSACPQLCPQFVPSSVPSLSSALSPVCSQLCPQFVPSLSSALSPVCPQLCPQFVLRSVQPQSYPVKPPPAAARRLSEPPLPTMHVTTKFLRFPSYRLTLFVNTWFVYGGVLQNCSP